MDKKCSSPDIVHKNTFVPQRAFTDRQENKINNQIKINASNYNKQNQLLSIIDNLQEGNQN